MKKLVQKIRDWFERRKREKQIKKRLEELRKQDPFIYD
jgi:hypothetical protein